MEGTQEGNSGVFDSIADAVAELDRREVAREAAKGNANEEAPAQSEAEEIVEEPEGEEVAPEEQVEEEQPAKVSVEFDGKTLEIPEGTPPELVEATQKLASDLKADYTRKTQAVAEEKKVVESAKARVSTDIQQLQQAQQALAQMAHALIGDEPDLSLAQTDPHDYLIRKEMHAKRVQQFQHLMQHGETLTAQQKQALDAQEAERMRSEAQALLKAVPELSKPEKFAEFRSTAIEVGSKYGISADEIAGLTDHRMILALRDLAKFHKQQAASGELKTKLQNVPPKVAKPGATQSNAKGQQAAEAKREFMKSARTDRDLRRYLAKTS